MSFRLFKVTDMIGFTFAPHCNWFVKSSKLLGEFCSWLAENVSWLALVTGSVIALVLPLTKNCENRFNKKLLSIMPSKPIP